MKPALLTVTFVLLAATHSGKATEPAADALAKPYYDCVKSAALRYAKKSPSADEVIQAAEAACQEERGHVKAIIEASAINSGKEPQFQTMDDFVEVTMKRVEAMWRPDLTKAILDAR